MANSTLTNQTLSTSNEIFCSIWGLTRTMLGAGYKYKASADASGASGNKDVTGNMVFDKWGVGGATNTTNVAGQTGSAASVGTASAGVSTITGLTGMVSDSVGKYLTITGATTPTNNGTFRIVSFASSSSVGIFNPAATSDANNGAIAWSENQGGAAASIGAPSAGRSTITGLTGMVTPTSTSRGSVGNRLTIIGAATGNNNGTFIITKVNSATSVDIENTLAVSDANNGTIAWVEMSPTLQTEPTTIINPNGVGAWVCLQGVSMMKIPIGTSNPTGYIRGENVTQASTGAQGELIGICPDTAGGLGFAVIAPRVSGSSAGTLRGWSCSGGATDNIVGSVSGATITPFASGTVAEFVQEFVFWKGTATANGHIYAQCVDTVAESTSRFSVQSTVSQCTNVVCPGGSTGGVVTTNGFPSLGTFVILGTGGSGAAGTGAVNFYANSNTATFGKWHAFVANCIEDLGVTADGTWTTTAGFPSTSATAYIGITYQRLDDCEEGDLWPYVSITSGLVTAYTQSRTVQTSTSSNLGDFFAAAVVSTSSQSLMRGWRRRGFPTTDAFQDFQGALLGYFNNSTPLISTTAATPDRVASTFVSTVVREPIWAVSTQPNFKMRKGSCRWMCATQGLTGNDDLDGKKWIQLSSRTDGGLSLGPWDGVTTAINSLWPVSYPREEVLINTECPR